MLSRTGHDYTFIITDNKCIIIIFYRSRKQAVAYKSSRSQNIGLPLKHTSHILACVWGDVCIFVTVPAILMCVCGNVCIFFTIDAILMCLCGDDCLFVTVSVILACLCGNVCRFVGYCSCHTLVLMCMVTSVFLSL